MMKLTRKSLSALVLSVVLMLPIFSVSATEGETAQDSALDANSYCVSLYSNMMQSFQKDFELANKGKELDFSGSDITQKFEAMLPDEYAGAFIDKENLLHVKFVDESNIEKYKSIFAPEDSRIVYENAKVSLKTLLTIQDILDSVMQDFSIVSTETDEVNNGLKIGLQDMSRKEEIINYLEKNIEDLPIENLFFEKSSKLTPTVTAPAGTNIMNQAGTSRMTIGYNAYRSSTGQYGVVTAGHGTHVLQSMYKSLGLRIGATSLRQYSNGTIDAAFVPFASNFTPSKSSDFSGGIVLAPLNIVVGMTTYKRGITSGYNTGSLVSISASASDGTYTLTDYFVVSNSQRPGDSGGPVWVVSGPGYLYGIATHEGNGIAYCGKAYNIRSAFGVDLYK